MQDYEMTPAYRDRYKRRQRTKLETAASVVLVFILSCVIAAGLVALLGVALLLTGCTTLTAEQQRELEASARGCYCQAKGCDELKSASGSAAVAAAGGQVVSITKVERPKE